MRTLFLGSVLLAVVRVACCEALKPLTVAEEIDLTHFNRWLDAAPPIIESPDGRFVAVWAERGILAKDLVEDELRVYDVAELRGVVARASHPHTPMPVCDLREDSREGASISQIRWLDDSRGLTFLLKTAGGREQLAVMDLRQTRPRVLSMKGQDVTAFDVRDAAHYVYTVSAPGRDLSPAGRGGWVAWDGTGQPLMNLLLPTAAQAYFAGAGGGEERRSILWSSVPGGPHPLISRAGGQAVVLYPRDHSLALSPDGQTLATVLPVSIVPHDWPRKYRSAYSESPYRIRSGGRQNLDATYGWSGLVTEYVLIDLTSGAIRPVNGTPTGSSSGWYALSGPAWAHSGEALLLPDIYEKSASENPASARPCAAVFYPATDNMECLEGLKALFTKNGAPEPGFFVITSLDFANRRTDRVVMHIQHLSGQSTEVTFERGAAGRWQTEGGRGKPASVEKSLDVYIRQGLNEPPVLVASNPRLKTSRVIWNPNPQLKSIALGKATVYRWKDATGHLWTGGLYKPANYVAGRRYPLVIQTHGFDKAEFRPSGRYPTAFAARALAASGIVVLQMRMCAIFDSPSEGQCNVAGYEAAVRQLSSQGLIDPSRTGIIGFSRTVYHVLTALTTSRVRFAAASVTDGVDFGYAQYIETADLLGDSIAHDANAVVGAPPFGAGLQLWLRYSPEFNMQAVHTPLLVVGLGRVSLLSMWEPYAALRYLGRPVDLMLLNSSEHVLTTPSVRMASQGGSVDWFRFWLQGYEDPAPAKVQQYLRWEELCDTQKLENHGSPTFCVSMKRGLVGSVRSERAQPRDYR